jgi:phosphatidate cytidylyltransferase
MKNLIVRTITGILFVAIIVVSFLDVRAMALLFALITGLTIWEFCGLVNEQEGVQTNKFICTVAGVYFFFAVCGFCSGLTPSTVFIPYLLSVVYLLISELYMKDSNPINNWAYTMLSQMYIALPLSLISVLAFRSTPDGAVYTYLIPLCVFVFLWCNDTGAYCSGSLFGRHKLFPRISPGKSWEGSIGGAILVMIVAGLIGYYTDMYGVNDLRMSIPEWIGLGLVIVVFGTWGDLVESLFKRTLGIKDSGAILPGHGGMLDRFDSSLMAIPAAVVYLYTLTLF